VLDNEAGARAYEDRTLAADSARYWKKLVL
jgi:hypothetical protein